ncbi:MAG: sugar transferase [Chloroflexi bacterium]|nr:sugar transferase [Chloroflexota bacterium]
MNRNPYPAWKRALDLGLTILALPIVVPLGVVLGIVIWIDSPGPVLFTQPRAGQHGRTFRLYKLRTMVPDAAELKASLAHLNVLPPPDFKIPNDPRITRVGRFLRRTSLDELPQLINVLRGEMSLVGPRPTSFLVDTYSSWHTERLDVRPGLTGRWQIELRGNSTFDERLRLDIAYVRSMSPLNDLKLIVQTFTEILRRSGT